MALRRMAMGLCWVLLLLCGCQFKVRPEAIGTMRDAPSLRRVDLPAIGNGVAYEIGMLPGDWRMRAKEYIAEVAPFCQSMDGCDPVPASDGTGLHITLASPAHFEPALDAPYATTIVEESLPESARRQFFVRWYRCYAGGRLDTPKRSLLATASYPLVGLPRDLVDVPFTAMRRLDLDRVHGLNVSKEDPTNPLVLVGGALFLLVPIALWIGIAKAAPSVVAGYVLGGIAALLSLPVLLLLWIYIIMAVGPVFRFTVAMPQTVLLRSWIDSEDYFPNWKFVVHDPQAVAGPRDVPTEWRVLRIAATREEAECDVREKAWVWLPGFSSAELWE